MTLSDVVDEIKHARMRVCELTSDRYSDDQKKMKVEEVNRALYRIEKEMATLIGKTMYRSHGEDE